MRGRRSQRMRNNGRVPITPPSHFTRYYARYFTHRPSARQDEPFSHGPDAPRRVPSPGLGRAFSQLTST